MFKEKALAKIYAIKNIIAIYKKTDKLNKNHKSFEIGFVLKSRRSKIELTKENKTRRQLKNKVMVLPYAYSQCNSEEPLNLSTSLCIKPLNRNKIGIAIANFCVS